MKTKGLILVAAAVILLSGVAVKPAIAYFTDTFWTEGKIELNLGDGHLPEMDDTVENMIKKVSIKNTGDYEVLVRAKAIYPDTCTVELVDSTGWTEGDDGYYYYSEIVNPGETTEQLKLQITTEATGSFNVIIIQEATKVIYTEDGEATGDWNSAIATQTSDTLR